MERQLGQGSFFGSTFTVGDKKFNYATIAEIQWLEGRHIKIKKEAINGIDTDRMMDFIKAYMHGSAITPRPTSRILQNAEIYALYKNENPWDPYLQILDRIADGSQNNGRYYSFDVYFYEKDSLFAVLEGQFKQETLLPDVSGWHNLKATVVNSYGVPSEFYNTKVKIKNWIWR